MSTALYPATLWQDVLRLFESWPRFRFLPNLGFSDSFVGSSSDRGHNNDQNQDKVKKQPPPPPKKKKKTTTKNKNQPTNKQTNKQRKQHQIIGITIEMHSSYSPSSKGTLFAFRLWPIKDRQLTGHLNHACIIVLLTKPSRLSLNAFESLSHHLKKKSKNRTNLNIFVWETFIVCTYCVWNKCTGRL